MANTLTSNFTNTIYSSNIRYVANFIVYFRYFNQLKHLKNEESKKQQQKMPAQIYDLDGKFSYTVYNPSVHKSLFKSK